MEKNWSSPFIIYKINSLWFKNVYNNKDLWCIISGSDFKANKVKVETIELKYDNKHFQCTKLIIIIKQTMWANLDLIRWKNWSVKGQRLGIMV